MISPCQKWEPVLKLSLGKEEKMSPLSFQEILHQDTSHSTRDSNMKIKPSYISLRLRHKALRQFHACYDGEDTHFKQVK